MAFFKKSIDFGQFIGDAIFNSVNFYDANSEKLIPMADEFKVLDKNDAAELKELGYSLIMGEFHRARAFRRSEAEAVSFAQRNFAQSLEYPTG